MAFACQASGTLGAVGQCDTALLFDVDGSLGFGGLLLFFFFGLLLFRVSLGLGLSFPLFTLLGGVIAITVDAVLPCAFAVSYIVVIVIIIVAPSLCSLFCTLSGFSCLFLLARLFLFRLDAEGNVLFGGPL